MGYAGFAGITLWFDNPIKITYMMKFKLLLLAVCSLWNISALNAQAKLYSAASPASQAPVQKTVKDLGDGKMLYGYCSPDVTITKKNGIGYQTDENVKITAAIRFSQGVTHLLKGRKIYQLKVGAAAPAKDVTVFIRNGQGENLWTKTTSLELGWNDIALDTPLTIPETEEIYIGYTFTQKNRVLVVATANETYKANGMFIASDDYALEEISELGNLCLLAEVEASAEEFKYVASLLSAYSPSPYITKGESAEITLTIFNEGEEKVSRVVLGRSFNGNALNDTAYILKRSMPGGSTGSVTFTVAPQESGEYSYTLKEIEGQAVSVPAISAEISLYNKQESFERIVLMEEFTSQQCGNCPAGQNKLHTTISGNEDRVAMVLHHSGYEPDAFTIKESNDYCYFYAGGGTYAPAMMMDRTYISDYTGGTVTPVYHPNYLAKSRFLQELLLPSVISVDIKSTYDEATRKLSLTVSGRKITDLIGSHVGLNVFLLESNYVEYQAGAGGKFEHNNFPRYVFSDVKGDLLTFNEDGTYSKEYTYTIPESYTAFYTGKVREAFPENMHVVAFVANFDDKRRDNCVVLNANKTASLNDEASTVTDINAVAAENPFNIYVEYGKVCIQGEYDSFSIYNLQGMVVQNQNLAPGIYIVKVKDGNNKEYTKKVCIKQ